jgi:hypothetical protein
VSARLLPRFYARAQEAERQRRIAEITAKAEANAPDQPETVVRATLPGDSRRLRGIPVIGGVSGTSPGSDPLAEALRRERQRERGGGAKDS